LSVYRNCEKNYQCRETHCSWEMHLRCSNALY
jgi:hypothetical protein